MQCLDSWRIRSRSIQNRNWYPECMALFCKTDISGVSSNPAVRKTSISKAETTKARPLWGEPLLFRFLTMTSYQPFAELMHGVRTGTSQTVGSFCFRSHPTLMLRAGLSIRNKKSPASFEVELFIFRCLTMSYSHMGRPHTTIGAGHFHFWVRHGIRWFASAIFVRQFLLSLPPSLPGRR